MSLDPRVESGLQAFADAARRELGDDLVSLTLFGSAAESRLRRLSDVNVLIVLRSAAPDALARLRPAARVARAAIGLEPMILLQSELGEAASAFAEKFADMAVRRRVLAGEDVLAGVTVGREALRARLAQSLLNLAIRLRRAMLELPATEDAAARGLSSFAGALRACAHSLLVLRGAPAASPREALERVAAASPQALEALRDMSAARESPGLSLPRASEALSGLLGLVESMRNQAARIE